MANLNTTGSKSAKRSAGAKVAGKPATRPAASDPRLKGTKQYACKIEAEPNKHAICVPYGAIRPKPTDGDLVHVRRTRGNLYEDTLRVVRIKAGRVRLELKGSNSKARSAIDYPGRKGEAVEIRGLVIGYHDAVPF